MKKKVSLVDFVRSLIETAEIMSDEELMSEMRRGIKEADEGKMVSIDEIE